jgi:hypothetical protein
MNGFDSSEVQWVRDPADVEGLSHFEVVGRFACIGPSHLDIDALLFRSEVRHLSGVTSTVELHIPLWHLAQRDMAAEPGRYYDLSFCHLQQENKQLYLGPMWIKRAGSSGAFAEPNRIDIILHPSSGNA